MKLTARFAFRRGENVVRFDHSQHTIFHGDIDVFRIDARQVCVQHVAVVFDQSHALEHFATVGVRVLAHALDALDNQWVATFTDTLDMGQIAVGCALDYLDFRREMGGWNDWRDGLDASS